MKKFIKDITYFITHRDQVLVAVDWIAKQKSKSVIVPGYMFNELEICIPKYLHVRNRDDFEDLFITSNGLNKQFLRIKGKPAISGSCYEYDLIELHPGDVKLVFEDRYKDLTSAYTKKYIYTGATMTLYGNKEEEITQYTSEDEFLALL